MKTEKPKRTKKTVSPEEKPRHLVMLTPNGKVLIPLRDVPPEQKRKFPMDIGLVIYDMKAVLK